MCFTTMDLSNRTELKMFKYRQVDVIGWLPSLVDEGAHAYGSKIVAFGFGC
jgi:hypothetical protein